MVNAIWPMEFDGGKRSVERTCESSASWCKIFILLYILKCGLDQGGDECPDVAHS